MVKPRLKDIAALAGVSEATASRVLNGRPGVREAAREAVIAAARELGRDLAGAPVQREPLVGVVVPDLDNPVFARWVEEIESLLFERGAGILVGMRARVLEREQEVLERLVRAGVSGVIVVSGFHAQRDASIGHCRALVQAGIPVAFVNGIRDDLDAVYVQTDERHTMRAAVAHLHELGHRAIGLAVGDEATWPVRQKVAAFEELIDGEGSSARTIAFTDFSHAGGFTAALELVAADCTAIVCGSDVMASGVIDGVRSLGLSVPADVSVVGYDDVPWAPLISPPLTTMRQAYPELSRAAVDAVLGRAGDSRRAARSEVTLPSQLIVRGSTAAAPRRRGESEHALDTMAG